MMGWTLESIVNLGMVLKLKNAASELQRSLHWIPAKRKPMRGGTNQRPFTDMLP